MAPLTFRDYLLEHLLTVMFVASIAIAILSSLVAYIVLIHRNKQRIQYVALHDSLTGLCNRNCFNSLINAKGESCPQKNLAVISMDLNGLKEVNDTMGHEAGDELITGAADCMKKVLSSYGSIYRVGGDEFVAILETNSPDLSVVVQDLRKSFGTWQGERNKSLSVSIGMVSNGQMPPRTLNELITMADQEMYKDKAAYYNRQGNDRRRR